MIVVLEVIVLLKRSQVEKLSKRAFKKLSSLPLIILVVKMIVGCNMMREIGFVDAYRRAVALSRVGS